MNFFSMSPLSNGHATSALMLGGIKDTSTDDSASMRYALFYKLVPQLTQFSEAITFTELI